MKKIVSLLLAVIMVMSMMTFTAMASTDTLLSASTAENSLATGPLDTSKGSGNCYRATNYTATGSDVAVVADGTNKIFEINGFSGSSTTGNVLYYLLAGTGYFNGEMSRFSAKIKLPAVEAGGVTELFTPSNNWTAV